MTNANICEFVFDSDFDSGNLHSIELRPSVGFSASLLSLNASTPTDSVSVDSTSLADSAELLSLNRCLSVVTLTSLPSKKGSKEVPEKTLRPDLSFALSTRPDAYETGNPTKNSTWFYYSFTYTPSKSITGNSHALKTSVEFHFINLNRVQALFNRGMRPVYRQENDSKWTPIPTIPTTHLNEEGKMELKFNFTFTSENTAISGTIGSSRSPAPPGKYYFAYCIPYSYKDMQRKLQRISDILEKQPKQKPNIMSRIPIPVKDLKKSYGSQCIYFHRDVLIQSCDGHNLDILTISSTECLLDEPEDNIEGLFSNTDSNRCLKFKMLSSERTITGSPEPNGKTFFLLSARVHPAETISSFILDGFLDFIISSDPRAETLRSLYVFKIIPMLNPDGVVRGHYRGDARGINLNRMYENPSKKLYPTIWATTEYIKHIQASAPVSWYIDFHGHANKPGCFLFGNWIQNLEQQYQMLLFAKSLCINLPTFDFSECEFAPKGMVAPDKGIDHLTQDLNLSRKRVKKEPAESEFIVLYTVRIATHLRPTILDQDVVNQLPKN